MFINKALRVSAYIAVLIGFTAESEAQIYMWRDAGGNMVVSNHRQGEGQRTFVVSDVAEDSVPVIRTASFSRGRRFDDLIVEHSNRHNIRTDLVRAVVQVESAFNPNARSPKGAMGLMQLMPATARQFGVQNPFNPGENIRGGVAYLRQLLDRYSDNEELALAAYNAGPGAVAKYGETVPPYQETKKYVLKIGKIAPARPPANGTEIYKSIDKINGREVVRYTDQP
jgi:soluble lytic murein transglycosylase-like protein